MIRVENLSYQFPQKDLYNKISFTLEEGQHCAFIGTSGSGKSTLIDILMNPDKYMYDGKLERDDNCRIGYISQFPKLDKAGDTTVFEYVSERFVTIENEIAKILAKMETSTEIEELLEQYQNALDAFEAIGGGDYESKITKQLNIANLIKHKDQKIIELSGGEFKLIQVVKEMLTSPNLLIMDEPDVFLDFDNINSLRDLINSYKGIILVITHNRYLLNHCFDKIIHLENMELQEFDGGYIEYNFSLLQKKIELQELSSADDEEIERNEILIARLRKSATDTDDSSKGKSLKARVKIQERLLKRRIKAPFVDIKRPNIDLVCNNNIDEGLALEVNDYNVSFDDILLENVNFEIGSKDKVAIIGLNGTGKTTLIRALFQNENPAFKVGEGIEMAYLSQLQGESLNENNTLLDEFIDIDFANYGEIKSYLFKYGFRGEIVRQKINSLSGGEKNILQLAKVSASKANFLLLDEPTSHLDTYSQIALEEAIRDYDGAIMMISHDYYSIVNSMDYVLLIEDKTIRKVKMKKFKRMIYKNHFNRNYLEIEERKKAAEMQVELALQRTDFEKAKILSEKLEEIIKEL